MAAKRRQAPLYLLTGLIIGLAIGLLVGYRIFPVQFFDITPVSLHEDFQQDYLTAVGLAYHADKDMGRAYSRISQMMSPVSVDTLRTMNLRMEEDADNKPYFEQIRSFINELQTYMNNTGKR